MARAIDIVQVKREIQAGKLAVEFKDSDVLLTDKQSGEAVCIATLTPPNEWVSVEERLPECEEEVFIQTERGTRTTAIYEDGTVREEDSIWFWCDIDGEWDEERDCMIIPKGWWEDRRFNPDDVYNNVVDEKVVAWCPLPESYIADN